MATHPSPAPDPAEFSLAPQGEYAARPPILINRPVVLAGSDEHCHLRLISSSVSRHHALIIREEDRLYVYDLGSRTKVLVNGQERREAELADGDEVRIGKFSFKFTASRPPTGTAAHPEPVRVIVDGQAAPTPPENRLVLIGRTAGSDVMLVDESVSSRHAVIFEVGGKRYVRDLDSRTGTFLNDKKIHQHEIKLGEELRIGATTLKLAESATVPAATPPAGSNEPLSLEPAPIPVADEVELPPVASVEERIPLALAPTEPSEQRLEPAAPVADHPFDKPLPLELEPEPPSHHEAESSAEPTTPAVDHSDDLLKLEPEPAAKEADEAAPPPAAEIDHSDEAAPLELEAEATPAIPAVDHSDDLLKLEPEPAVKEADEAAPPPAAEIDHSDKAAPLELEAEATPATPTAEEIVSPAPAASSDANEETHLDLEPLLPEAESAEQPAPAAQAVGASDVAEPEPKTEAAQAIDLSDAPEPSPETEAAQAIDLSNAPEPSPETEAAGLPAAHATSALDLLAELAAEPPEEFKPVEFEPEPLPETEPAEPTAASSAATIDLSDAPSVLELEPEAVPGLAEPPAVSSAATIDLSDAPSVLELEPEPSPSLIEKFPVADSDFKTVDLETDWTPAEIPAEHAPINFDPAPAGEEAPPMPPFEVGERIATAEVGQEGGPFVEDSAKKAVEAASEVPAEAAAQKAAGGRKRQSAAEPKPFKARRSRAKRVPPKPADEKSSGSVEAPAPAESEPLDIEPLVVEPPVVEPLAVESPVVESPVVESPVVEPPVVESLVVEPPVVESPVVEPLVVEPLVVEPLAVESPVVEPLVVEPLVVESPAIEIPELAVDHAADEPPDSSLSVSEPIFTDRTLTAPGDVAATEPTEAGRAEPPPVEPARLPEKPFLSVGQFAYLTGGTVNVDHSLGGQPIKLPELSPVPAGFGHVRVSLAGKASSPFSSFARSEPLVFDEPEAKAPPPPPALAQPESIVAQPAPPPAPVKAPLETVVTPPPPASSKAQPAEPRPAPKPAPPIPRLARPFATERREIPLNDRWPPGSEAESAFGQATSAFDGLAPALREADAFSNFDAAPLNDAAFGGARLSRSDEYNVPESPETAARLANGPEYDFAEDDFWNRTDEEDGLPAKNIPPGRPAEPVSPAADHEDLAAPVIPETPADPEAPVVAQTPADSVEPVAPIPAEALEPDAQRPDSGEASGPADNSTMESSAAASSPSAASSEQPVAPPPRRRRRFRIPFLMPVLLVAMGLALGAIWRFMPVQSQIVGKIIFENYNWTPGTRDGTEFEASQRRLLDSDQTRRKAVEFLRRDHPDVSAGFLEDRDLMGRVVSSVSLNSIRDAAPAQTALQLSYSGANPDKDRMRVMALLQGLVDFNAPLVEGNRRLRNAEQRAQQTVDETQQKLEQIKTQLASLQTIIDAQPSAEQMAKLTAEKAQLEKSRDDAEEAVNRDRDELARLEGEPGEAVPAASTTLADPSDPQLKRMRQQLADLAAAMDSAHSDQVAGAVMARQQLETAAKQFNDQLSTADEVLGASSQLRQFVDSARDSQAKARDLINMLIVDGEDLEKQLEDTRRDVEDLIEGRREEKWANDRQLQQLRANLDSAQHRYNANVGDGNKDPRVLDPLQREIDNWTEQIKARQQELGVDPSEIKVEEGLNHLVQTLRNKLQKEKQQIGQVLDPLEKQLSELDPVVGGLPEAEQDLARQLRQRLGALNEARQKYAEAVGEGEVAPSAKITELQKQIAELKDRAGRREQELAQQTLRWRDAEHMQDVGKTKNALDSDQKTSDTARKAYGDVLLVFEEKQAERDAAEAAQQRKINLLDAQRTARSELETAQRDRDEKQSAAERAFDIKPISEGNVIAAGPTDERMMYSLWVLGAGVVALAGLTFVSHTAAHRAHHTDASGHPHEPAKIAEQLDSLVLPMTWPPRSGQ